MDHPGLPPLSEALHLALDDLEDLDERLEAHERAHELLAGELPALCARLSENLQVALEAAGVDVASEYPGFAEQLRDEALGLLAYVTGRSLVGEALGAEDGGGLVQAIEALAPEARAAGLNPRLEALTSRAYDKELSTLELRRFRMELLRGFHPQVRASALAALDPERLDLALTLCDQIEDTQGLLDTFDQIRAEADVEAANLAPGPPRHFSWVHVAFALLIIALTAYHYLLR